MKLAACAALLVLLAAGCGAPGDLESSTSSPTTGTETGSGFDGQAAYDTTAAFLRADDGTFRYRIPGTALHAQAAAWLVSEVSGRGWYPPFPCPDEAGGAVLDCSSYAFSVTGAQYEALPKGSVASYAGAPRCSQADQERVRALTFTDVGAILPNAAPTSNHTLILMAHWDSKRLASADTAHPESPMPGANDGASGVGILLQFMREVVARNVTFPFQVMVLFVDGEDGFEDCHPLAGSIAFARTFGMNRDYRVLLLDMVGDPAARFPREKASQASDPNAMDLLWSHAATLGLAENFASTAASVQDDTSPFWDMGIPAVDLIDAGRPTFFPPYWHTTRDTMANLNATFMGKIGQLLFGVLLDPAFSAPWPARQPVAGP